jgi:hypothetical protein
MTDSPFTVVAELAYDPATDTLGTSPGPFGIEATDPGTPVPGNRVQHRRTRNVGTVLSHGHCAWPEALGDGTGWSYVRFDSGHYAYCPNADLAPRNGEDTFR